MSQTKKMPSTRKTTATSPAIRRQPTSIHYLALLHAANLRPKADVLHALLSTRSGKA